MLLQSGKEYLKIKILRRSSPNNNDYWDGNWLESEIKINTSNFNGTYRTNLRTDDFLRFREDILESENNHSTSFLFTTMEEGIFFEGRINLVGVIEWTCIAKTGNDVLNFSLESDLLSIKKLTIQIENILKIYPVVGEI